MQTRAQLTVTPNANATFLVNQLIGPGITVTNATLSGPFSSAGTFNGTASNIGLPGGVLLTSGDVNNAPGPNSSTGISTSNNAPGDAQLNALSSPFLTEDACILEFDMVATCDTIQISYVFGSDEYDEWVCTSFTDVFAFFISGPGIVGAQNIAVIPNTTTPISINTVNIGAVGSNAFPPYPTNCNTGNSAYYTTNNLGSTVEYDGFTVPLIAKSAVIPCSTYHIKLAIADAGDDALDSGVFLEQGGIRCASTFYSVEPQVNSPGVNFAVEGCVSGGFTFHRDGDSTQALTMYYSVGGTATPGLDYPALPGSVNFPPNSATVFLPINATSDGLNEPTETIFIILTDTVCGIVESDTAVLEIGDQLIVNAGPDQTICEGTSTQIGDTTIPSVSYTWTPGSGLSSSTISDPNASPNAPGTFTYIVQGIDTNQCQGQDTMTLTVIAMPDAQFTAPANVCLGSTTTINYTGSAPQNANYSWNFGSGTIVSGSGQGPYNIQWNTAGLVYVTLQVTDNQCVSRLDSMPVNVTNPPSVALTGVNSPCFGQPQGSVTSSISNGVPGFSYLWSNGATTPNLGAVMAGSYSVTVTDNVGCVGTGSVTITQNPPLTNQLTFIPILCNGGTGTITANPGGGSGSYTYLWSNGATTQTILPTVGVYTVTVTDANSGISPCTISNTITMNEPPAMNLQISPTVANCGQNTGTANAIISGGVQPYTYNWSNGGSTAYITGLGPGPIAVTVTDANGCTATQSATIVQTPVPTVTAGLDASFCEGEGGVGINATGTGGTLPYYYTWNCANPPCGLDSLFDNDPNANPTSSQYFCVQITDGNGCTSNIDSLFVTVLPKPIVNAGPDIYLCGDSAPCHILTPTITNATGPYTYNWSPSLGLNNSTIANPCARPDTTTIYALVVTAGNGCTSDFTTTDTLATVV
ncbi:MAG: choice-of-anchor L domain-containing protein, partial [Bacteroidia bacterium]